MANELIDHPESLARHFDAVPAWTDTLNPDWLQNRLRRGRRLKGLGGALIGVAIGALAVFALTRALATVRYDEVFAIIRGTGFNVIALSFDRALAFWLLPIGTMLRMTAPVFKPVIGQIEP